VKLNLSLLDGFTDDVDFCMKLAKEESVVVLPGKNSTIYNLFLILSCLKLFASPRNIFVEWLSPG
jgi:tyrosine aminotransferase